MRLKKPASVIAHFLIQKSTFLVLTHETGRMKEFRVPGFKMHFRSIFGVLFVAFGHR
jgi:hypothetical protein